MNHEENIHLIGSRFGSLVVVDRAEDYVPPNSRGRKVRVVCKCDCGKIKTIHLASLKRGLTRSCGCLRKRKSYETCKRRTKHGHAGGKQSRTYETWHAMIRRCTNNKSHNWKYYGGRGIEVCDRWRDFSAFLYDMGERPANHTIDRIDVNGNYDPSNCRWATAREQAQNRRPKAHDY